jgi:integrase
LRLTELTPSQVAGFVEWLCDEQKQGRRAAERRRTQKAQKRDVSAQTLPLGEVKPFRFSDATISNTLAPLRACLASAVREGLIRTSPARDIDLPHRPTLKDDEGEEIKALTRPQLTKLLAALPGEWRPFFWLLAATGMRTSEATALQWQHLQLEGQSPHVKVRRAYVRGKFGPPKSLHGKRDIPIHPQLAQQLKKHHQNTKPPTAQHLVFPNTNGAILDQHNLRTRTLKPAARAAGVPWAGFHTFRHTCATLLFAGGANAVQVQRWLGHHSPAFTLASYVHLLDGDLGQPLQIKPLAERRRPTNERHLSPACALR